MRDAWALLSPEPMGAPAGAVAGVVCVVFSEMFGAAMDAMVKLFVDGAEVVMVAICAAFVDATVADAAAVEEDEVAVCERSGF